MSKLFGSREIDEQARAWIIELDDEAPSNERLGELRSWLGRSPLHRRAFERAASAWRDMDSLRQVLEKAPAAATSEAGAANVTRLNVRPRTPGRFRIGGLRAGVFAVTAILLVSGILTSIALIWPPGTVVRDSTRVYQTATGVVTTITLQDGSRIHLNTASRVRVSYGASSRALELAAGEAYFEVAADPRRPFVVHVGRFAVRALGTAFAVHMLDAGVDLTVTQGRVELAAYRNEPGEVADARYSLSGGQHATVIDNLQRIEHIDAKSIEKRLAWRDGMLIFDDDPLEEVVAEISRYTATRIVIADPSIRNLKIGGFFKVQDINSILETLQESFAIEVRHQDANTIYLSRGQPAR